MGTYTKNLKLETPSYTDSADIPALTKKNNYIIDSEMIKRANGLDYNEQTGVLQLTGNNSKVGSPIQIKNNLPVTSMSSGTELKVNNYKQLIKFTKEGKTEQKTYTGKNLFYDTPSSTTSNGITLTKNSDGSFTLNGTSTDVSVFNFTLPKVLLAGTYTFSIKGSGNIPDCVFLRARDNSMTMVETQSQVNGNNTTQNSHTFTCKKDISIVAINITQAGITFDNFVIYPQLEIGSEATEFEPYVGGQPSPNPNYPQKIENISGVENLFDKSNYNASKGVSTSTGELYNSDTSFATDYIKVNVGYYTVNSVSSVANTVYGAIYDSNKKFLGSIFADAGVKTFKISNKNAKYMRLTALNSNLDNYQIERGNKMHSLVPYGSNYLQLENVGENILNIDETPFTVKKITSQGNVLYWSGYSGVNDFVKVKEKTTYKFSSNEVNKVCYIDYYDKNKNYLSRTGTAVDYFTTPENCKYIKFAINLELIPTNAQLREGTIIKSYEPYKKKIINIDLKGNNLCSNKDKSVKDELLVENGKAKIYKKIKEVVLNGTEGFAKTEEGFVLVTNDWGNKNKSATLSNYFTTYTNYSEFKEAKEGAGFLYENVNNFYIKIDGATTVNEFRAKLKSLYNAGTPVRVQYELAEPKVIDLGKVDFDLIENSTLTCEEESDMQIDYLTISSNIFVQDSLDGNSNQKAPSVDAIKKYFGKKVYDKDENGWIKIEFFDHTEYVTEGQITQIDFSTGWGVSKLLSLPVGMSTIGDRILSGNVRTFDAAISVNISGILTETQITYNWKNNHSSNVTTGLNYSLRILEYV